MEGRSVRRGGYINVEVEREGKSVRQKNDGMCKERDNRLSRHVCRAWSTDCIRYKF